MTALPSQQPRATPRGLISEQEVNQKRMIEDQADPGVLGYIGAAADTEHLLPWLLHSIERDRLAPDPDFKGVFADDKLADAMTSGIDPTYWGEFSDARSLAEAQTIRRRLIDIQDSHRQLQRLGYGGVALSMGAAIMDPAAVAAGFLTGGGTFIGSAATRGGRALRAGLVATAGNLPVDAALADLSPDMDTADVALGAVSSFALGGFFGGLVPAARVDKVVRDAELEAAFSGPAQAMGAASRFELSPEGRTMNRQVVSNVESPDVVSDVAGSPVPPSVGQSYTKSDLLQMSPEELQAAKAEIDARDREILRKYFPNKRGTRITQAEEDFLYENHREDYNALFMGVDTETLTQMSDAAAGAEVSGTVDELATEMSLQLFALKDAMARGDVEKFTDREMAAAYFMRRAPQNMINRGLDPQAVSELAVQKLAERIGNRGDAEELLSVFIRRGDAPSPAPEYKALQAAHANRIIDSLDPDPEVRTELEKLDPAEVIRLHASSVEDVEAPEPRISPAGSTVRPATDAEVTARQAQVMEEHPSLSDVDARRIAEQQIKAEDAAAAGDGGKPPKEPKAPPDPADAVEPPAKRPDTFDPQISTERGALTGIRFSMVGRLLASASDDMRALTSLMADNRVVRYVNGKKVVATDSATAAARRRDHAVRARFARVVRPALIEFKAAAKKAGRKPADGDYEAWFGRLVSDAIESNDAFSEAVGPVKRVAAEIRRGYADQLDWIKSHGLEWAMRVNENENYFTRIWKIPALKSLEAQKGRAYVIDNLLTPAIAARMEVEVDPGLVRKFASKWYEKLMSANRDDINLARILGGDPEAMRGILDEIGGMSDEVKDRIIVNLAREPKGGTPGNFRRRTLLDIDHEYVDPDTGEKFALKDFTERNALAVYERYIKNTTGAALEGVVLRKMGERASREFKNWDQLTDWMRNKTADTKADIGYLGFSGKSDRDLKRLDTLRRWIRGMPLNVDINSTGEVAQTLRNIRSFNTIQRSGGFGFAAVTELSALVGEYRVSDIIARMPEAARVTKMLIDGKAPNELLQQFEMLGVNPGDLMVRHVMSHLDFDPNPTLISRALGAVRQPAQRLTNLALSLSGMPYVDAYSRVLSVLLGVDKFAQMAHKHVASGVLDESWFAELGMDAAKARRLLNGLSAEGVLVTHEGSFGRKVKRIDMAKLEEVAGVDAVHDLVVGMDRMAVRTIQTNDISLTPRFMDGEVAKIITQFRTFAVNAYETHTLRRLQGLAHGEYDAYAAVLAGSVFGGLVYAAQQYIQSLGMEKKDAEKFRAERLTYESIGLSGFARTGTSSLLPPILDNISTMVSGGPIFTHARYTELNPSGLFQNPTFANMAAVSKSAQTGFEAVFNRDDQITKPEADAFFSLLPFRNLVGVRNVLDAISSRLPDRERR